MKVSRLLQAGGMIMGLLFLFGVAVQYNDPDPLPWMAIYGVAALASFLAARGRLPGWLPALAGIIAVAWSATLLPGVLGRVSPLEMFEEFEMESALIEQAREAFGLLIIAAWMLVLFIARPRKLAGA